MNAHAPPKQKRRPVKAALLKLRLQIAYYTRGFIQVRKARHFIRRNVLLGLVRSLLILLRPFLWLHGRSCPCRDDLYWSGVELQWRLEKWVANKGVRQCYAMILKKYAAAAGTAWIREPGARRSRK